MRISVRCLRRWRITSCPAAWGMRWVNPSIATVSPSRTFACTAAARDMNWVIRISTDWRLRGLFTDQLWPGQMRRALGSGCMIFSNSAPKNPSPSSGGYSDSRQSRPTDHEGPVLTFAFENSKEPRKELRKVQTGKFPAKSGQNQLGGNVIYMWVSCIQIAKRLLRFYRFHVLSHVYQFV